MNKVIFITGATGFVGQNLVLKMLKTDKRTKLVLLVRGNNKIEAKNRLEKVLLSISKDVNIRQIRKQIEVVNGNVSNKNMGLNSADYTGLMKRITHIIHSAANTKFNLTLDEARETNCNGTKNVMDFARLALRNGKLKKIAHISTAFVSGNRTGTIYENDLEFKQQFSNTYEQSKFESELMIRKIYRDLPVIIFRPSIIVGNSRTGETTNFNVLYYPLNLLYRGYLKVVPGWKDVLMDVVPVDFVCDAIYHILLRTSIRGGKTYHLTAGMEKAMSLSELTNFATRYFNSNNEQRKIKSVIFLPPLLVKTMLKYILFFADKIRKVVDIYGPYLEVRRVFDNKDSTNILAEANISPPALQTYLETILGYCLKSDWGNRLDPVT